MAERSDKFKHPRFDPLAPDSEFATSDVAWPPRDSRQQVANGGVLRETFPEDIVNNVLHRLVPLPGGPEYDERASAEAAGSLVAEVGRMVDGDPVYGSYKAAAYLGFAAALAARVGWTVTPHEPTQERFSPGERI